MSEEYFKTRVFYWGEGNWGGSALPPLSDPCVMDEPWCSHHSELMDIHFCCILKSLGGSYWIPWLGTALSHISLCLALGTRDIPCCLLDTLET